MDTESKSPKEDLPQREPVEKAEGVTPAEKYLARLCEKNFLSLWSYPGVYRDQGKLGDNGHGKEICDLLVIFGRHIIIFSDKHCVFQDSRDVNRDWRRWFKKAILKSAEQAWGAERWIRQQPSRIFLDRECKRPLPIELPRMEQAIFHLVVVAHGVSSRIRNHFSSESGSLMLDSSRLGFEQHTSPFYVGDIEPQKTFIHVFDDDSLQTLMKTRDTISDFVAYLSKREKLLRSLPSILATGEEQLLAVYLTKLNDQNEHDFVFPITPGQNFTQICLPEGHWEDFQNSTQRIAQIEADKVSYAWDELIEKFSYYALRGEQYFVTDGGIRDSEKILRFMASEPRWKRRDLAKRLLEMIHRTPIDHKNLCVIQPRQAGDPFYVFLLLPMAHSKSIAEYREVRRQHLNDCCLVTKAVFPEAKDIVGIATETDPEYIGRSEDSVYLDAREWTDEMDKGARELQKELGILTKPKRFHKHVKEFPDLIQPVNKLKNPRNKPCPCGSGKKYKHCCLGKVI